MKTLYSAHAMSHGGRDGHVRPSDGMIDMKVRVPKEMGGASGATNPEQLFAAGYSACFENAILFVARAQKLNPGATEVAATVGIGPNEAGGFQLSVKLEVKIPGLPKDQAQSLIDAAHKVCPYSNATRGNVPVELMLVQHG
ncbi:MAG: organic hydroperoxide resistance protein [Bdellovibrionales bacterium]|nr:organic hydroperoxide resistance protein [Bdellovibrionales bacterium]